MYVVAYSETDDEMKTIEKDALETTKSIALGLVICSS